jgi:hypothetical protein
MIHLLHNTRKLVQMCREAIDGGGFQMECVVNKNACANADAFVVNGECHVAKTPSSQYNCIAEQADPNFPTCPSGAENDPSFICFQQVGRLLCARAATPLPASIPSTSTPSPSPSPSASSSPSPSPSPSPTPTPVIITNVNNNQVTVRNDGGFTVQNYQGAVTTTPDCPPQSATVLLGPSTMENGGARILASFEPCVLTDGSVY